MSSLFSSFDPHIAYVDFPLNWVRVPLCLLALPCSSFWATKAQTNKIWIIALTYVDKEFNAILGSQITPGRTWPPVSLFAFILLVNGIGLIPYVFPSSSHLVLSASLACPLWVGHMAYSWSRQPVFILAHLVPSGTPSLLLPFMVIIELISRTIRPLTLSVRLAANIVAGHLLLTLLSAQGARLRFAITSLLIAALMALSILENAVAVIQAYVFSILSTLYMREVQSQKINY
jgi:F-type H+-transporting ATPase subunit a